MRTGIFVAALAVLGSAAPSPGWAQTPATEEAVIINDTWAPDSCRPATARRVSFAQALASPTDALKCVTFRGLWAQGRMYPDLDGYYSVSRWDSPPEAVTRTRLGVYGPRDSDRRSPERPKPTTMTGTIEDCDSLYEPGVIFVSGYCHYWSGRFVALGRFRLGAGAPVRRVGQIERDRLGQLVEMPEGTLHDYVAARAEAWRAAVLGGDPTAYSRAYGDPETDDVDDADDALHTIFRVPGSVFARLRNETASSPEIWTIVPPPPQPDDEPIAPSDVHALACYRLGDWRDDRWPVAPLDADNDPIRPYACVLINRVTWRGETEEGAGAVIRRDGLLEPRWPARR